MLSLCRIFISRGLSSARRSSTRHTNLFSFSTRLPHAYVARVTPLFLRCSEITTWKIPRELPGNINLSCGYGGEAMVRDTVKFTVVFPEGLQGVMSGNLASQWPLSTRYQHYVTTALSFRWCTQGSGCCFPSFLFTTFLAPAIDGEVSFSVDFVTMSSLRCCYVTMFVISRGNGHKFKTRSCSRRYRSRRHVGWKPSCSC